MAEENGVIETIRESYERIKEGAHTCDRVENLTNIDMNLCVTDKSDGTHHVETLKPGETLQVDPRREDIEGILHADGSATKIPGFAGNSDFARWVAEKFGWTAELTAAEVATHWPECAGHPGNSRAPLGHAFLTEQLPANTNLFTFVRVNCRESSWHEPRGLEPNREYRIIPRTTDRWSINLGASFYDFHGGYPDGSFVDGASLAIPKSKLPIGGLVVLVWEQQDSGPATPHIFDFPVGTNAIRFKSGPKGGSIHFLIADLPGTYADNFGECIVAVAKVP